LDPEPGDDEIEAFIKEVLAGVVEELEQRSLDLVKIKFIEHGVSPDQDTMDRVSAGALSGINVTFEYLVDRGVIGIEDLHKIKP